MALLLRYSISAVFYLLIALLVIVGFFTGAIILLAALAASVVSACLSVVWVILAPFVYLTHRLTSRFRKSNKVRRLE